MRTLSLKEQQSVSGGYRFSRHEGFVSAVAHRVGVGKPQAIVHGSAVREFGAGKVTGPNGHRWLLSLF